MKSAYLSGGGLAQADRYLNLLGDSDMNETSIEAYWYGRTSKKFSKQAAQVLDDLNINGPATRVELARRTGFRLSAICGRVNELIGLGLAEEAFKVPDPDTLRNVWAIKIKGGV